MLPARGIQQGDKVRICMNGDSYLSGVANEGAWTVLGRPRDVGDTWVFEHDGQVIEINPNSANFDGLELAQEVTS